MALFLCSGKSNSCTYRVAKHAEYKQACAPKTVLTRYGKYFFSTQYCLRVFFEDVSTDKKSSSFDLSRSHPEFSDNQRQKQLGRLYNLTVVHFNPEKREFSLLLNIPRPPCSMLGYNRTITRTNINVLINIGPGAGGGRKRRGKKGNLPNTFDDDCRRIGNQL